MAPRDRIVIIVPQRRRPLRGLLGRWSSYDRRRRGARITSLDRRLLLDEDYVVDAMARQIEEIRNLPEVGE
jgi:hypothetical protein